MTSYEDIERQISVLFIKNSENIAGIVDALSSSGSNRLWTALDSEYVLNSFHVRYATLKSLINQSHGTNKLKTRQSWHAEVLYQLAPTTNITEALNIFGLKSSSNDVCFVLIESDIFLKSNHDDQGHHSMDQDDTNAHSSKADSPHKTVDSIKEELIKLAAGSLISEVEFNDMKIRDYSKLITLFKVSPDELAIDSLESILCTRLATKDVL